MVPVDCGWISPQWKRETGAHRSSILFLYYNLILRIFVSDHACGVSLDECRIAGRENLGYTSRFFFITMLVRIISVHNCFIVKEYCRGVQGMHGCGAWDDISHTDRMSYKWGGDLFTWRSCLERHMLMKQAINNYREKVTNQIKNVFGGKDFTGARASKATISLCKEIQTNLKGDNISGKNHMKFVQLWCFFFHYSLATLMFHRFVILYIWDTPSENTSLWQ